jgi:hypothetical protein
LFEGHYTEDSFVMGIFLRKPNTICDMYPSNSDRDVTPETLSDSNKDPSSLVEFLHERRLITMNDCLEIECAKQRVEASGIVNMMVETCTAINRIAGENIVDMHIFLSPEPNFCCFIFVEDGMEYFMRLELRGAIPTLSFAERKCRDTLSNDFVRWVHRLADIEPVTITISLVHEFQEIRVSVEQVRDWFKYLVSRLDSSYMPSLS